MCPLPECQPQQRFDSRYAARQHMFDHGLIPWQEPMLEPLVPMHATGTPAAGGYDTESLGNALGRLAVSYHVGIQPKLHGALPDEEAQAAVPATARVELYPPRNPSQLVDKSATSPQTERAVNTAPPWEGEDGKVLLFEHEDGLSTLWCVIDGVQYTKFGNDQLGAFRIKVVDGARFTTVNGRWKHTFKTPGTYVVTGPHSSKQGVRLAKLAAPPEWVNLETPLE